MEELQAQLSFFVDGPRRGGFREEGSSCAASALIDNLSSLLLPPSLLDRPFGDHVVSGGQRNALNIVSSAWCMLLFSFHGWRN